VYYVRVHRRPPPPQNPFKSTQTSSIGVSRGWVPKGTQTQPTASAWVAPAGWIPKEIKHGTTSKAATQTASPQPMTDSMSEAMARLLLMGFTDVTRNGQLLRKHDGNLQLCIDELLGVQN
jgi:hypothetical protein